jgi:phosphatidylserine/phosphatidylglycerophosphate/cardiolipin synthase-like enzyme
MKKYGYLKEWEVISRAVYNLDSLPAATISLKRSNPSDNTLRDNLRDLMAKSRRILYIAVQIIDTSYMNEIIDAAKRNVDVRVIVGRWDPAWTHGRDRKGIAIESFLKEGIRIRLKKDFHVRMIVVDDNLFVGSLDLDAQGLSAHDNLTIETTDITTLSRAREIFLELENTSEIMKNPG